MDPEHLTHTPLFPGLATVKAEAPRTRQEPAYMLTIIAFLASLALVLLVVVEIRRGLLFTLADYVRIGAPTAIFYLDLRQVPLLLLGTAGVWLSYRRIVALEKTISRDTLKLAATLVGIAVLVLLVADLFVYRGVAAYRIAAAAKIGIGQAIPITAFPDWAQAVRQGLNYLALVWHATLLSVLLGGLFLALMAGRLQSWLSGTGFKAHLRGAALALPQPFCSCCSAPIGATLYRQGASLGTTLAFIVSSPMLNVTGLLLALILLPWEFSALRLVGGVAMGIFATYIVSVITARWTAAPGRGLKQRNRASWFYAPLERYARLFDFQRLVNAQPGESPGALIRNWMITTWRLGRIIVPVILIGSIITAAAVAAIPSPGDNLLGVVAAAAFGTLVMVPTWAEIPIASQLIEQGLRGPAASLVITLPAVSVPCLAIISGAITSLRVALLLGVAVFAAGLLAGVVFLAL